jgi:tetratricopeptide (TPR) repeat protein
MHFYYGLARASLISGEPKKAIEYAEQALSLDPRGPQITTSMIFLGVGHMYLGHDDLAIEWLEKARAETPKNPNVLSHLAVATQKGDLVKAKAAGGGTAAHRAQLQALEPRLLSIPIIARGVQKTVARTPHASG